MHTSPFVFAANQQLLRALSSLPQSQGRAVRAARPADDDRRLVALSFDDGPSRANTVALLEVLAAHAALATFFMVGARALADPDLARAVVAAGHEVGNHSFDHEHPAALEPNDLERDFARASDALESTTGVRPVLIRPPFGKRARELCAIARSTNERVVLWAVDSGDTAGLAADEVAQEVLKRTRSGDIVLMHDGGAARPATLQATATILESLTARGFRFVTISQLLSASLAAPLS